MSRILNILLIVLALGVGGCKFGENNANSQPQSSSGQTAGNDQITQLEDELDIRGKQVEELRIRAAQLAKQINKLEFLNNQLEQQLKAVGNAPRQRDEFKQKVAEKQLEIDRLKSQIRQLTQALGPATPQPTTKPD